MKVFIKNDKGERVECDYVQVKFRGEHVGYVDAMVWVAYTTGDISGNSLLELASELPTEADMLKDSGKDAFIAFSSEEIIVEV